jgi:hypothetical protein
MIAKLSGSCTPFVADWLVDALIFRDYKVHSANTTAVQKYSGMKDKKDAF